MKKFALAAAFGAACLGLAACGGSGGDGAGGNAAAAADEAVPPPTAEANAMASAIAADSAFPKGARIVEEEGVTYRIDPDGTRVRLSERDSRIVVENGIRYRVDPGGGRVRIDGRGLNIDLDTPDVKIPDVDAGINRKGNPDIDVKARDDGDTGAD
jgi:hypothetical protein